MDVDAQWLRNGKCHFPVGPFFHTFEFVTANFIFRVCFPSTRYVVFLPNLFFCSSAPNIFMDISSLKSWVWTFSLVCFFFS